MKNTPNRIDYQSKFIRDSIKAIQRNTFITVIGKHQQTLIEQELSILHINYRTNDYTSDIRMYIKEEER